MNWQAEFLDNPEIRLTFDHFPFFQKQGIMENRFSFDYQHYDSPEGMPAGDRELVEEAPGRRPGVRSLFQIPGRRCGPFAQREDSLRQQPGERGVSCGHVRRTVVAVPCRSVPCRRSDRGAGHRFGAVRAGVLSLRTVPPGAARCGASPEVADPYHHVRCGRCHGGGFGRAAASFHVPVIIRFAITLRFRCLLPKIFCTRTTTF
jgi:hypothetical protein